MPDTYRFGNQEFKMSVRDTQEIPLQWGGKLVVHNCIVGGAIDARFIPAIVKGLMDRMEQGPPHRLICPRCARVHLRRQDAPG